MIRAVEEALSPYWPQIREQELATHERVVVGGIALEVLGQSCRLVNVSCSEADRSYRGEIVILEEFDKTGSVITELIPPSPPKSVFRKQKKPKTSEEIATEAKKRADAADKRRQTNLANQEEARRQHWNAMLTDRESHDPACRCLGISPKILDVLSGIVRSWPFTIGDIVKLPIEDLYRNAYLSKQEHGHKLLSRNLLTLKQFIALQKALNAIGLKPWGDVLEDTTPPSLLQKTLAENESLRNELEQTKALLAQAQDNR